MFYLVCNSMKDRIDLINHLKSKGILTVFHYMSLHESEYYRNKSEGSSLIQCNRYSDTLLRFPLYFELTINDVQNIVNEITSFFEKQGN